MNRIGVGPITAQLIDRDRLAALEGRAADLGVIVSTRVRSGRYRSYLVTVHDYRRAIRLAGEGSIEAVIAGALDDWEARWTPEEVLTVAAQSGVEVTRA